MLESGLKTFREYQELLSVNMGYNLQSNTTPKSGNATAECLYERKKQVFGFRSGSSVSGRVPESGEENQNDDVDG